MFVHTRRQVKLPCPRRRVGGQGHDRNPRDRAIKGADPRRSLEAVQARHLHVHEDRGVAAPRREFYRLQTVLRDVDAEALALEDRGHQPQVHTVVVGDQDARRTLLRRLTDECPGGAGRVGGARRRVSGKQAE